MTFGSTFSWGSVLAQMFLEHFILGALYLGKMQKGGGGGGKVIADRFGALLKIFIVGIPSRRF